MFPNEGCGGDGRGLVVLVEAKHRASRMGAGQQAALFVERGAVGLAVPGAKGGELWALGQLAPATQPVIGDVAEEQVVPAPDRTLGEH